MIIEKPNICGEHQLKIFKPGDCVSYKSLKGERIFGILCDIHIDDIENDKNRKCAFGEIKNMHGEIVSIILLSLNLESKAKSHEDRSNK